VNTSHVETLLRVQHRDAVADVDKYARQLLDIAQCAIDGKFCTGQAASVGASLEAAQSRRDTLSMALDALGAVL